MSHKNPNASPVQELRKAATPSDLVHIRTSITTQYSGPSKNMAERAFDHMRETVVEKYYGTCEPTSLTVH